MTGALLDGTAQAIAAAVRTGTASAREIAQLALNRIKARNGVLGAFTDVTAMRALARADAIDAARMSGTKLGPLAGAPFAVKNLFDVVGLPTRAGSKINRDRSPARADATLVARMEAAGGVLVGSLFGGIWHALAIRTGQEFERRLAEMENRVNSEESESRKGGRSS